MHTCLVIITKVIHKRLAKFLKGNTKNWSHFKRSLDHEDEIVMTTCCFIIFEEFYDRSFKRKMKSVAYVNLKLLQKHLRKSIMEMQPTLRKLEANINQKKCGVFV